MLFLKSPDDVSRWRHFLF